MPEMLYDYRVVSLETVRSETDAALALDDEHVVRAVASVGSPTFDDTLLPRELAGAALVRAYGSGAFIGQVHPLPAVRDEGNGAEERINKLRVVLVFRSDLYDADALVRAFLGREPSSAEFLRLRGMG
jgi:Zn-dependent oligopeptidase